MAGLSFGQGRSYDDFKSKVPKNILPLFEQIREYCISLGQNVVEDIRMHRIVFGKSMTFRWFADVAPSEEIIVIKIQKSRKEQVQTIRLQPGEDFAKTKNLIKNAYDQIH